MRKTILAGAGVLALLSASAMVEAQSTQGQPPNSRDMDAETDAAPPPIRDNTAPTDSESIYEDKMEPVPDADEPDSDMPSKTASGAHGSESSSYKGALTQPPADAMNKTYPVCSKTRQDSCRNPGGR